MRKKARTVISEEISVAVTDQVVVGGMTIREP